ncbi:MAG: 50S ribosomal protein L10, partial [Methanosphaera sp. rholeuAM6]
ADWKKEKVAELEELTNNNEIIGIVNLADIPARQLQTMRKSLGDSAILKMSRKNFIKIALENSNKDVSGLADYLEGQPAMVFTEMNPFKLFKILEDSKTEAPAKAGAIAPADIVVPAGDTSFPPGPILGELQQAGIPAKIDKGSIVVQEDATVVEEGEPVPKNVADILTKLEIYPMEVGMDLLAVCEGDTIYTADVLKIDEEETLQTIVSAYQNAINLSVNAGIANSKSMPLLIQKASRDAMNLAINANILTSETTDKILSKAYAQMLAVASLLSSDALDDELSEKLNSVPAATSEPADNTEEPEEEVEEEEEEEEVSAAAGLGALFG